jgi:hypothetical protein
VKKVPITLKSVTKTSAVKVSGEADGEILIAEIARKVSTSVYC